MALITTRNPAHDFIVKLSLCICSHNNCPGWRNGCNLLAYVIPRYLWWGLIYLICLPSLAYYAHVTVDSDKVCCVPWAVCSLLRLAPQWWINWLVTILTQCWCHIHTICNSDRERPGSIYRSNDINVYLGRQRGVVGSLTKRIIFHPEQAATFALYTFSTLVLGMILLERASKRVLVWKTPPLLSLCKMTLTSLEVLIPALFEVLQTTTTITLLYIFVSFVDTSNMITYIESQQAALLGIGSLSPFSSWAIRDVGWIPG